MTTTTTTDRACAQCGAHDGDLSPDGERTLSLPADETLCSDCWCATEPIEEGE